MSIKINVEHLFLTVTNLFHKYIVTGKEDEILCVVVTQILCSLSKLDHIEYEQLKKKMSVLRRAKEWGVKIWLVISLLMGIATLTSK